MPRFRCVLTRDEKSSAVQQLDSAEKAIQDLLHKVLNGKVHAADIDRGLRLIESIHRFRCRLEDYPECEEREVLPPRPFRL